MYLAYLHKQKIVFLENSYWDKGKRIGNLIYDPIMTEWRFWPERGEGISVGLLFQITAKLTTLNNERKS